MLARPVLNAIAIVVTLVWLGSWVAQLIPALDYKPDPQINLIFGVLVSGLFAVPKLTGRDKGETAAGSSSEESGRHRADDPPKAGG